MTYKTTPVQFQLHLEQDIKEAREDNATKHSADNGKRWARNSKYFDSTLYVYVCV